MPLPPFKQSDAEWVAIRRCALARGFKLTKSIKRARELVDAAILDALDPNGRPWDPELHPDLGSYICSLVWSLHGTELASYRVTHASNPLNEAGDDAAPSSRDPERLLMKAREAERAARCHAALLRRAEGDALVMLLLQGDPDEDEDDGDHDERPNAEPASTRRALAKGYTHKEIKNARERLKRLAMSVAREEKEVEP